ncbi:MAG: hypothetical protein P8L47_00905 [Candidatus Marinamargulisbacteria bacterium]|jgi:hypothetical protein|nr:hypothetical protein [bacterium]MDG2264659.1 hypothetical protein [Candidatus Marinamargulisbacteria bacterium]|tara:strand:+ start:699 stop:986 length:288 start_codon:yes stop_codon:yes gene_type:complete
MTQEKEQINVKMSLDVRLIRLIHDIESEPKFDAKIGLVQAVLNESESKPDAIQAMQHMLRVIHNERFQQLRTIGEIMKLLEFVSCQGAQTGRDEL